MSIKPLVYWQNDGVCEPTWRNTDEAIKCPLVCRARQKYDPEKPALQVDFVKLAHLTGVGTFWSWSVCFLTSLEFSLADRPPAVSVAKVPLENVPITWGPLSCHTVTGEPVLWQALR